MELRDLVDRSGHTMSVKYYDGVRFPLLILGNVKDHLEDLSTFDYRPDDTLVIAYPKSGTHWLYEIVNMIKSGKAEYHRRNIPAIEYFPTEYLENVPSPRVYVSHLYTRHLPKNFIKQRRKIVYIYRNPKDVSVSFYHFIQNVKFVQYEGTWEDLFDMWIRGETINESWFDHIKGVEKFKEENPDYPICTVSYEDMKKDLLKEVRRIATFLEPNIDDSLCREIAEKCQFSAMFKEKNENVPDELKALTEKGNHSVYRKGEVGDWKNWFTVAMNERFDSVYEKEMKDIGIEMQFTI